MKEKNKRTNTDLGQLQAQEREFVTLCILRAFVDYRGRVFCAKLLQKPQGMLTHLWLSSLTASFRWPSFPLDCYLTPTVLLCSPLSTALTVFPGTFLPSFLPSFLPQLPSRGRSRVQGLCLGFAPKQTKRFSDRRAQTHTQSNEWPHSVTICFIISLDGFIIFLLK